VAEGTPIPLPTLKEIAAALLNLRLSKKSKVCSSALKLRQTDDVNEAALNELCVDLENSLERDKGTSTRAVSAPTPHIGKRLGAPPSRVVANTAGPSYIGAWAYSSLSRHSLSLGGVTASGHVGKFRAEVVRRQMEPLDVLAQSSLARDVEYDHILDDDFGTVTHGEEIELTLFPLILAPYQMSYQYEGAPLTSALDSNICRKDLDRTITPAELKRTESLLPLDLSNHFNVLSALLVSHEKLDQKREDVNLLQREVTSLDKKLKDLQKEFYALGQENRDLRSQRDVTSNKVQESQSELT
ncbi:hypothetical protein Tco_0055336, partial [Tanacetum coccineum]